MGRDLSHAGLIRKWGDRIPHRGKIEYETDHADLRCDDRLLTHRTAGTLAVYLGEFRGERLFLRTADRLGLTTVTRALAHADNLPGPQVPFSALRAAGVVVEYVTTESVLGWDPERNAVLFRVTGPLTAAGNDVGDRWLLCGWDPGMGGRWGDVPWVSELRWRDSETVGIQGAPHNDDMIGSAFWTLMPPEVVAAEHEGRTIRRQGEWFFVAAPHITETTIRKRFGVTVRGMRTILAERGLPAGAEQRHIHQARYIVATEVHPTPQYPARTADSAYGGFFVAPTRVEHLLVRNGTPEAGREHPALHIPEWSVAYRNTALASWGRLEAGMQDVRRRGSKDEADPPNPERAIHDNEESYWDENK